MEKTKLKNAVLAVEMRKLAEGNTEHYLEYDLMSDEEILLDAAASDDEEDRWLLWMTRENGTWLFGERRVWLKDSEPHKVWTFYLDMPSEHPRAYLIHVAGFNDGNIVGDIAEIHSYKKHAEEVLAEAVPAECVLKYENGECVQDAGERVQKYKEGYGELLSSLTVRVKEEYQTALNGILKAERENMD